MGGGEGGGEEGIYFEILVEGTKRRNSIFCGSSVGGTCQGWSILA